MKLTVTLTGNAGVILNFGENGHVYGVDALHDTKGLEFSCLSPEQIVNTFEYFDRTGLQALLVTHNHVDHCSPALLERAAQRYADCHILEPWKEPGNKYKMYSKNGVTIAAVPLPHRYAPHYPAADNYGFVINIDGKTVFTPGDAEPLSPEMIRFAENFHPDVALLPFLWVTLSRCRKVLDTLAPKNVAFIHLPFEEQDTCGYNHMALAESKRFYPDSVVLNRHMQSVTYEL